ncbi:type IX secretion system sortase PorU [Namhaeicola litoreus]|uniref:Type IX secretion system sortase PorU n=1 Tax=Namhaeicola litoreus TaxID=1052145 RepID=A0ABW3Y5F3_9FLAO
MIFTLLMSCKMIAQNTENNVVNLHWKTTQVVIKSGVQVTIPTLENEIFNENLLPVFSTDIPISDLNQSYTYDFIDIKTQIFLKNELPQNSLAFIPSQPQITHHKTYHNKQWVDRISVIPIYRENGAIRKIISFSYKQTPAQNNQSRNNLNKSVVSNSVLSQGTWYKFSIDTSGVFKLDRDFLNKLGISTQNINPNNIRIFGNGGKLLPQANSIARPADLIENAIKVVGGEDGRFDNNDYILFFGQGPESWNIEKILQNSNHVNHIYSDLSYYFITVDQGNGLRIGEKEQVEIPNPISINTYHDFYVHELDERNLFANGQQWLGEDLSFSNSLSLNLPFENMAANEDLWVRFRGVTISSTSSQMSLSVNGVQTIDLSFAPVSNNSLRLASTAEGIQLIPAPNTSLKIDVNFNNNGNPSARGFLDYIEIIGTKKLVANGNQFIFRNTQVTENNGYEFTIDGKQNIDELWDISDPYNPIEIKDNSTDNTFKFQARGGENSAFIVLNDSDFYTPTIPENSKVANQNLHSLKDVQYVLITDKTLISEAKRLTDYHQKKGLTTALVDIEHVYNEFSSGAPDVTAIRDFVKFLYDNASSTTTRIKYLCLFGDASFDFKDGIDQNNNIVPAFQSYESFDLARGYVTDDYFGMMAGNAGLLSGSDQQEVATGRIPVSNLIEAKAAIDKILTFENNSFGDWRNEITMVADDPDDPSEFVLQQAVDQIAQDIEQNHPVFNIKKIYADAYQQETSAGGERYPSVNLAIDNAINAGTLLVDYFGHGGVDGWANERILEVPQIQNWTNTPYFPLMITVTCEFSRFDNPLRPSAGEYVFWSQNGGSSAMITTTREIFISTGQIFNRSLIKNLLNLDNRQSMAEALMQTKNQNFSTQKFFVYHFGDPAIQLGRAQPNVQISKLNGIDITQSKDTLKALSKIKIEGWITNSNNQILDDFNGEISTTIFDKPLDKTTLDNDNFGRKMEFTSVESKIFRGRATVSNGKFELTFVVPRDIRIAFGKAKFSFYANNSALEFAGLNNEILIGGLNENAEEDNLGPEIKLFLNDEYFVEGGNTDSSPVLIANLFDASGINTSITAVDHDIIAILDNDEANPIVLNDYYKTELDDFTRGEVRYKLSDLEPGVHTILFKCWDTYNNLSESALNFVVVDDSGLVLSNVLNYPNPFVNYTEFWFNHNKPNQLLESQVQIFTISGKLIKTLQSSIQTNGNLSREINWDGLDDFGNKIGKGVYIYKLKVTVPLSNLTAEKIEKLVIL